MTSAGLSDTRVDGPVPARAGIGLKPQHYRDILDSVPDLGFFEVHAENYMGAGGPPHRWLEAIRARYPLSLHGVAMSIGAARPLDDDHLARFRDLVRRYEPGLVSEHLAWSTHDTGFINDLLPLPYTAETLARVCEHVDALQAAIGRRVLIENPSTYVRFAESEMAEVDFLAQMVRRTGCGLLLDVNNVAVSAANHDFDAGSYLEAFPLAAVGQIHLAGHAVTVDGDGGPLLIDAHGSPVTGDVWALYADVVRRCGPLPTLIEWDNDVPSWPVLLGEAAQADAVLRQSAPAAVEVRHAAAG